MLNQIVVVGRLSSVSAKKLDGKEVQEIVVACPRSYKNENGEYDTDFIPFILTGNIATNTLEYCKAGDVIGVKGSICGEALPSRSQNPHGETRRQPQNRARRTHQGPRLDE